MKKKIKIKKAIYGKKEFSSMRDSCMAIPDRYRDSMEITGMVWKTSHVFNRARFMYKKSCTLTLNMI